MEVTDLWKTMQWTPSLQWSHDKIVMEVSALVGALVTVIVASMGP